MSIEFTIRKGTTNPTSGSGITLGEPAFNYSNNTLWIGKGYGVTAAWVGAGICGASGGIDAGLTYQIPTLGAVKDYFTAVSSNFLGTTAAYVASFNGRTGAVQGVSAAVAGTGISVSGATGSVTITNTGVQSFNGLTGAVAGVASVNGSTGAVVTYVGTTGNIPYRYGAGVGITANSYFSLSQGGLDQITDTFTLTGATIGFDPYFNGNLEAIGLRISRNPSTSGFDEGACVSIDALGKYDDEADIWGSGLRLTTPDIGGSSIRLAPRGNEVVTIDYGSVSINAPLTVNSDITTTGNFSGATGAFSKLLTASAGLSAAGGVTFSGTFSGATASFSKLLTASAGVSASALTVTTTGSANRTSSISMASGAVAANEVVSTITLNAYNADSGNIPAVPYTRTGYIRANSDYDLKLQGGGDSYIGIAGDSIQIGDIDGANNSARISFDTTEYVTVTGILLANNGVLTDSVVPLAGLGGSGTLYINCDWNNTGEGGANAITHIGDLAGEGNNTFLTVDDNTGNITVNASNGTVALSGVVTVNSQVVSTNARGWFL